MMLINDKTSAELISVAHEMADAARAAILPFFRTTSLNTENKLDDGFDPVTVADRAAEEAMREVLTKRRPQDGVLGEEFGAQEGTSGLTWVLDPIDGTRGFISGTPTWGVLIAASDETGPVLGVVDQPYIGERFFGGFGIAERSGPHGAMPLKTKDTSELFDAILFTTFPEVGTPDERAAFERVSENAQLTRYGMDCYAYALVAAGQVDLVIEAGLNAYDIQGPIGVIQAAGGVVTDWEGNPAHEGGRVLAAANAEIHAKALEILRKS
ncbi:histidinol-phosphatase [Cognatishimia activa]|uniref:Histidinol-phosphatase n=1 Tax=Cognatishimia activa TaxID=1715691 RepID=A0A0P1IT67_9RHOB|nr:histidinol-phosphatase [Cognatishimia activa]CUI77777.1 Histidinol-phosphatase [Cognatishimia activa]CUK26790.1 Histidinol-phosphatase [Cognatishimia activa]